MNRPVDLVSQLQTLLSRKRASLAGRTTAFRWVDGELDDLTVDCFDDVAVLSLYREFSPDDEQRLGEALTRAGACRAVYLKRRPKEARRSATAADVLAPPRPIAGEAVEALTITECGRRFEIRPGNGLSVGLYLDARDARDAVQGAAASGGRMLNLFAYTCGFGVAAALGGMEETVNVDVSRKVLDWGTANYELNQLPPERAKFIADDSFAVLKRLAKRGERFDLIVLDPPSFSSTGKSRFSAKTDYGELARATFELLAPGGTFFPCVNLADWTSAQFKRILEQSLGVAAAFGPPLRASTLDYGADAAFKAWTVRRAR